MQQSIVNTTPGGKERKRERERDRERERERESERERGEGGDGRDHWFLLLTLHAYFLFSANKYDKPKCGTRC